MGIAGRKILSAAVLLIYVGLTFFMPAYGQQAENVDVVVLEHTKLVTNITAREQVENEGALESEQNSGQIGAQNIHDYINKNPYDPHAVSFEKEKNAGDFSYGLKYDASVKPDDYKQSETIFFRYQKNKLSVDTSFNNENFASWQQRGQGTLAFSPEYKLNDHLSIQNIYSTNFLEKNKKSEFVFSIKPFNDDRVNFNVGASHVMFSESVKPPHSQLNFSTRFKL